MVVVTYGLTGAPATDGRARLDRQTRLFARFMKALRDSRLRQARRVIERHAHLLPAGHCLRDETVQRKTRFNVIDPMTAAS
jgi:hypothetical protein